MSAPYEGRRDLPACATALRLQHQLWDLFVPDWRELLELDALPRSRRRVIDGVAADTAAIWRTLDFYFLLAAALPPHDLVAIVHGVG